MASETTTDVRRETGTRVWWDAALAGLAAGIVMGLLIQFVMGIMPVIGALYGVQSLVVGWVAHLFHSVVFALVYAAVTRTDALEALSTRLSTGAALGAGYGLVVWVVAAAVVMPLWMSAVGLGSPPVPNVNPQSIVGHLVYGVVLGVVFAALRD